MKIGFTIGIWCLALLGTSGSSEDLVLMPRDMLLDLYIAALRKQFFIFSIKWNRANSWRAEPPFVQAFRRQNKPEKHKKLPTQTHIKLN
jgi:hypothetical protein